MNKKIVMSIAGAFVALFAFSVNAEIPLFEDQMPKPVLPLADQKALVDPENPLGTLPQKPCFNIEDFEEPCITTMPSYSSKKATEWTEDEIDTYSRATVVSYEKEIGQEEYDKLIKGGWNATTFRGKYGIGGENAKEAHAGIVFTKGKQIVISYRGSGNPGEAPEDWVTNLRFESTSAEKLGLKGKVHKGFYDAAMSSIDTVDQIVQSYLKDNNLTINDVEIVVTGHSLGGAIAQVAAAYFHNKWGLKDGSGQLKLMTLAAPRFAVNETAKEFDAKLGVENHIRMVIYGDPVPAILDKRLGGYKHTGTYVEIKPYQVLSETAKENFKNVLPQVSSLSEALSIAYNDPKQIILAPARVVTGFGAALWSTLSGAPLKLHNKTKYQAGANEALQNWREDPEGNQTIRRYVQDFKKYVSIPLAPLILWRETAMKPYFMAIEYGFQKVAQAGFYMAEKITDGTVGKAATAVKEGVVTAAKAVGSAAQKAWGWAKSWF